MRMFWLGAWLAAGGPQWTLAQRDGFIAAVMVGILLLGTWAIFRIMVAAGREPRS